MSIESIKPHISYSWCIRNFPFRQWQHSFIFLSWSSYFCQWCHATWSILFIAKKIDRNLTWIFNFRSEPKMIWAWNGSTWIWIVNFGFGETFRATWTRTLSDSKNSQLQVRLCSNPKLKIQVQITFGSNYFRFRSVLDRTRNGKFRFKNRFRINQNLNRWIRTRSDL